MPAFRPVLATVLSAALTLGMTLHGSARAELTEDTLLGPGLRWRPAYDGSSSRHTEFVPVVRYFGQPWFVRSTQGVIEGGARMELSPGLHIGAQVANESGRKSSESDFLSNRNAADIDPGASVGAHLEWDHKFGRMPVTFLARARQHTDSDRGAQVDLRLSAGVFQSGRLAAGVFAQTTWANAKSTGSYYGLTPQQAAATGLQAFNAGSGWLFASLGLLWSVELDKSWMVVGSTESRYLRDDAARSPLVQRRSNNYLNAGLAYRF